MSQAGQHLVVFDSFVLRDAVQLEISSPEQAALRALIDNCPHRLLFNDSQNRLVGVYTSDLGPLFQPVRANLSDLLGNAKLVVRRQRHPVEDIAGLQKQHDRFVKAAVALRPDYLVTRIRQILERPQVVAQLQEEYSVKVVSPDQFATLLALYT